MNRGFTFTFQEELFDETQVKQYYKTKFKQSCDKNDFNCEDL